MHEDNNLIEELRLEVFHVYFFKTCEKKQIDCNLLNNTIVYLRPQIENNKPKMKIL